jgi:hypothetical protein
MTRDAAPRRRLGGSAEDLQLGVSARLRKKLESYFQTSYGFRFNY